MRIKSSFKDYYDCCQRGDREPLYIRNEKVVEELYLAHYNLNSMGTGFSSENLRVGFCGKVYTAFKFYWWENAKPKNTTWLYNRKLVEDFLTVRVEPKLKQLKYMKINLKKHYEHVEEENDSTRISEFFQTHLTPIVVVEMGSNYKRITTVNVRLNQYEFFKIFGPQEAFQEIEMFMSNLAFPNRPIPHVSDEDLALAKGFDKWSFRKPPKGV